MIRQLLAATAAVALMGGVAMAQNAPATDQPMKPPAANDQSAATTAPTTGDTAASSTAQTNVPPAAPGAAADMGKPDAATAATGGGTSDMTKSGSAPSDTAANPPASDTSTTAAAPTSPPATGTDTAAAPTTPPAASTDTAATPPAASTDTKAIASGDAVSGDDLMGRDVVGSDGKELGSVSDVVLDSKSGQIKQVVISSGGFLGIGAKTVALDYSDVTVQPEGGIKANSVTQNDIDAMPEFDVADQTKSLDEKTPEPAAGPVAPMGGAGMGAGTPAPATPAPAAQ